MTTFAERWAPYADEWGAACVPVVGMQVNWFDDTGVPAVSYDTRRVLVPRWAYDFAMLVDLGHERDALRSLLARVPPHRAATIYALGGARALDALCPPGYPP